MSVGLFFGSFNPIHTGHLIIANHILNETNLKKIWFIVSPQNPFKDSKELLNEHDRLHLVRLAIEDDVRMKVVDIEFSLPKPSYTIDTLTHLSEKYPEYSFTVIMGSDSFRNLEKWKNYREIIKHFPICVYLREGFAIDNKINAKLTILQSPLIQISATQIRELVKTRKSIKYLVPENVRDEIETRRLYKKGT